jgi:17beta-estradiol 17-dehydrogenase / very-long-chain 3-oxoacyl-CoA reductase
MPSLLNFIIKLIGTYILARASWHVWLIIQEILILKELNLLKRYGPGTWALITGATDGIGLGFAN